MEHKCDRSQYKHTYVLTGGINQPLIRRDITYCECGTVINKTLREVKPEDAHRRKK
jgi:hypothetical protein